MIKTILFDMGGVVFLLTPDEARRRFAALGVDTDKNLGIYGHHGIFQQLEEGSISREEFRSKLSEMTGHEVSDEQAAYCWLGFKGAVPPERLQRLLELRRKYRVCLASNNNPYIIEELQKDTFSGDGHPMGYYFDYMYCSYQLGICKPDPEFFRTILRQEGIRPEEAVFLDDSIKNVETAASLGIHTILVAPDADWRDDLDALLSSLQ